MSKLDFSKYIVCLAIGENKLYESLNKLKINLKLNFEIKMLGLHVGDILIGCNIEGYQTSQEILDNFSDPEGFSNFKPLVMIERKSISDFSSSFSSQHYHNQKSRMISFRQHSDVQCHLVVEEYYKSIRSGFCCRKPVSTLEQCFTSIRVRDKFFVKHVASVDKHAEYLVKSLKTLEKYKVWEKDYSSRNDQVKKDYVESLKARKKANLTPEVCFQLQISTIPGISNNMAEKIVEVHPNILTLIEAFKTGGKHCLSEIKVGKNRFGKIKSERIHHFLGLD